MLSALLAVEDELGYIHPEAVDEVAGLTHASINEVWAVASFYTNFRFEPPCEHIVEVCWGPTCHLMGTQAVLKRVQEVLGIGDEGDHLGPEGEPQVQHMSGGHAPRRRSSWWTTSRLGAAHPIARARSSAANARSGDKPECLVQEGGLTTPSGFEALRQEDRHHWAALEGKPWIRVGTDITGLAAGARDVLESFRSALATRDLDTTLSEVGCAGLCFAEPLVDIKLPGGPRVLYRNVTPDVVPELVEACLVRGEHRPDLALGTLGEGVVDGVPRMEEQPVWALQTRIATRLCGAVEPADLSQYLANGDRVEVQTPGERVVGTAALTSRLKGVVSVTMRFGQLATALQESEALDPMLRVPSLDVLPARVRKV